MQSGLRHGFYFLCKQNQLHIFLKILVDRDCFCTKHFEVDSFLKPIEVENQGSMNLEIRLNHDNKHFAILKVRNNFFLLDDYSFLPTGVKINVNKLFKWQLSRFFLYFLG